MQYKENPKEMGVNCMCLVSKSWEISKFCFDNTCLEPIEVQWGVKLPTRIIANITYNTYYLPHLRREQREGIWVMRKHLPNIIKNWKLYRIINYSTTHIIV